MMKNDGIFYLSVEGRGMITRFPVAPKFWG